MMSSTRRTEHRDARDIHLDQSLLHRELSRRR
jgi:hypothetical protein